MPVQLILTVDVSCAISDTTPVFLALRRSIFLDLLGADIPMTPSSKKRFDTDANTFGSVQEVCKQIHSPQNIFLHSWGVHRKLVVLCKINKCIRGSMCPRKCVDPQFSVLSLVEKPDQTLSVIPIDAHKRQGEAVLGH